MKKTILLKLSAGIAAAALLAFAAVKINSPSVKPAELTVQTNGFSTAKSVAAPKMAAMRASDATVYRDMVEEENAFESPAESASSPSEESFARKLIYTGDVFIETEDLSLLQSSIEAWSKKYSGYIANSSSGQRDINFTVKIPAENFEKAMAETGSFGKVKNRNINTNDVSEEFYDLQGRLATRKLLKTKLEGYLKQSGSLQDLLKVERELNSVQTEIESMEGRLKRLTNRIDFSTITIYGNIPFNTSPDGGYEWPDLKENFRHFVSSVTGFFAGLLTVLLYIAVCGIPLLAVLALLYWLLFGKIGLLIKLFKLINKTDA